MKVETYTLAHGAKLTAYIQDCEFQYHQYQNKPAMLICPGGAYLIHATREQEPVAIQMMGLGFQTFILEYSVGNKERNYPDTPLNEDAMYPLQVIQALEAIHFINEHKEQWHISDVYGIGFSAGGHVIASAGVRWNDAELIKQLSFKPKENELKLKGMVLGYPMIRLNHVNNDFPDTQLLLQTVFHTLNPTQEQIENMDLTHYVNEDSVPTFIWNCVDDPVVEYEGAIEFVKQLHTNNVNCEYHMFSEGGHGEVFFNPLTEITGAKKYEGLSLWLDMMMAWIQRLQ